MKLTEADLFAEGAPPQIIRRATISADNQYRYRLTRWWAASSPLYFVMLNPSTADDRIDDPTIRRCMGFARREGCGGIVVVNLYALRATDPAELAKATDPFGPQNSDALSAILGEADVHDKPVVCAWGTKAGDGARRFLVMATDSHARLACLGTTKEGHPRHPLYVRAGQPLVVFPSGRQAISSEEKDNG